MRVLSPALTDYSKRVFYVTDDVTKQLTAGKNAIGVMLGNGRYFPPRNRVPIGTQGYGYPKLLLQLDLEYADGKHETVVSDESWKLTTDGPIRANNEYDGEEYDARKELRRAGRAPDSTIRNGSPRQRSQGPPGAVARADGRAVEGGGDADAEVRQADPPGVWIFDMGQNMVGWARLSVTGPKGTEVTLRFAETLKPDGTLYLDNLRSARATDVYMLKGGGPGDVGAALHLSRFPLCRGDRVSRQRRRLQSLAGPRGARRDGASGRVRMLRRDAEPHPPQHLSGAFAAITAASRPIARSATNARAGWATAAW